MNMLSMSISTETTTESIMIYDDDMGGLYVDFNVGGVRKVTTMDLSLLADVAEAVRNSGLMDIAGAEEYGEGMDYYAITVYYTDWSSDGVTYAGVEVPESFFTVYNALVAYVETLLADVPEYVPQAAVYGDVEEVLLSEMQAILGASDLYNLDMMAIQPIDTTDAETFSFTAMMASNEGISDAAICMNMMMGGGVFTLVIVRADDTDAAAADMAANVDWTKDVCVQPTNALTAVKGDLVVCLRATDAQYTSTAAAIVANGWTVIQELDNPNM